MVWGVGKGKSDIIGTVEVILVSSADSDFQKGKMIFTKKGKVIKGL